MLTQYKSHSLDRHISQTWRMSELARRVHHPGAGAAAARPALVHRQRRRDLPVAEPDLRRGPRLHRRVRCRPRVPDGPRADGRSSTSRPARGDGRRHPGAAARGDRVRRASTPTSPAASREFLEKPADPPRYARRPRGQTFASMGNYIFTTKVLHRRDPRRRRRRRLRPRHGRRHHPAAGRRRAWRAVYDFDDNEVPGATDRDRGYWRDVGTLDAFYDAHMDLVSVHPVFNLYNQRWPIRSDVGDAAAGQVRRGRHRAGVDGRRGHDHLRRRRCATRCCRPNVRDRRRRDRRGQRDHARRPDRPRRRGAPRDPGQERRRRPTARWSASTSRPTGSATPSARAASWCSARASPPSSHEPRPDAR